jgi:lactate racemase
VILPYGQHTLRLSVDAATTSRCTLIEAPMLPGIVDVAAEISASLDSPVASTPLERRAAKAKHVTIVISDATRSEPRSAMLDAIFQRLPASARVTIEVATGTHGPTVVTKLGIDRWLSHPNLDDVVNHNGHSNGDLVVLGTTPRGTPVRVHRCLVNTDLVIATGCIRSHYFAGFGAGVKAIFPGLGGNAEIRKNHELKLHPRSRAGIVDDNPCRQDLEDAVRLLATPTFLLNGIAAADHQLHAFVAGDMFAAFRHGADLCRQWCRVSVDDVYPIVVASDQLPVTASLYQASKIAAAVAHVVAPYGRLIIVAECADGIGPLDVVNNAIFATGIAPRLATGVTVELVSTVPWNEVAKTFAKPVATVEQCLGTERWLLVPQASGLIFELNI